MSSQNRYLLFSILSKVSVPVGPSFAFSFGGGLRYAPGGRFMLTADLNDYLYQIHYPTAYYVTPTGGTAAITGNQARSFWKNNRALTIGASLLFFR